MNRTLKIGQQIISDDSPCYVIAEIGHNHQGSLEQCKKLFHAAKEAGASAVKLQKRDNRSLFTKEMYDSPYNSENAYGPTYGSHREALEFGYDEYIALKKYAEELEITFFSTAFDIPSIDFLEKVDLPAYKIASGDITNIPLLERIARLQKPTILSTGGAQMDDVERAYECFTKINPQLAILQCTSGYPCDFEELNLRVIETFRSRFPDIVVGYSGHDNGIAMALGAYMLGARIIEKHFTLNRALRGTDHAFSLEPTGLRKMVRDLERLQVALGDGVKKVFDSERKPLQKMAKKLVAAGALPAGHVLTVEDVALRSPNDGLPPYELPKVVGKRLKRSLAPDENIDFADLEV